MKYLLKFMFPFLRSGVEVKRGRWVLPLNTQCLQNSAESGERSVLTLGSLCLPCCVRDTAWSWFIFNIYLRPLWRKGTAYNNVKHNGYGSDAHMRQELFNISILVNPNTAFNSTTQYSMSQNRAESEMRSYYISYTIISYDIFENYIIHHYGLSLKTLDFV